MENAQWRKIIKCNVCASLSSKTMEAQPFVKLTRLCNVICWQLMSRRMAIAAIKHYIPYATHKPRNFTKIVHIPSRRWVHQPGPDLGEGNGGLHNRDFGKISLKFQLVKVFIPLILFFAFTFTYSHFIWKIIWGKLASTPFLPQGLWTPKSLASTQAQKLHQCIQHDNILVQDLMLL